MSLPHCQKLLRSTLNIAAGYGYAVHCYLFFKVTLSPSCHPGVRIGIGTVIDVSCCRRERTRDCGIAYHIAANGHGGKVLNTSNCPAAALHEHQDCAFCNRMSGQHRRHRRGLRICHPPNERNDSTESRSNCSRYAMLATGLVINHIRDGGRLPLPFVCLNFSLTLPSKLPGTRCLRRVTPPCTVELTRKAYVLRRDSGSFAVSYKLPRGSRRFLRLLSGTVRMRSTATD